MGYKEDIALLLSQPERLMTKKPFIRGSFPKRNTDLGDAVAVGDRVKVSVPDLDLQAIDQSVFLKELDPSSHDVLFDDNIPAICVINKNGGMQELKFVKTALPIQEMILNKHVLHMCGNKTIFTLNGTPSEQEVADFSTISKAWVRRNMDGMRTRFVTDQMSCGDSGLLFYHDRKGRIKARVISYKDGYVICSHNDNNGDRLLESIVFNSGGSLCIDSYDDEFYYRHRMNDKGEWTMLEPIRHGFSEIPLVTKRGDVPWGKVQSLIEVLETLYNVFMVIEKRHGWGILYIKGSIKNEGKKLAGAIVLQDNSPSGNGSAQYLTAPSPEGMLDTMKDTFERIQMGSGTTFILPKDISLGGDISGVAVQIAQSLDNESALQAVIDWQNAISKMERLFREGYAKELVNSGADPTAITRFSALEISVTMKPWKPRSETEYNNMLSQLTGAGLLSRKTGIEKNTESQPDEFMRIMNEAVPEDNGQAAAGGEEGV